MAQQAFLARQRRSSTCARLAIGLTGETSFTQSKAAWRKFPVCDQIGEALLADKDRLAALFEVWDENGDGELSRTEFRRAVKLLGVKASKADVDQFLSLHDLNANEHFSLGELMGVVNRLSETPPTQPPPKRSVLRKAFWPLEKGLKISYKLASTTTTQTILYVGFVSTTFFFLTGTLRVKEEYFLDKSMNDMFFSNVFDRDLNRFPQIRRAADIYEWGNQVLWPGLLGNGGPSCANVGTASFFRSADPNPPSRDWSGICNDDTYSDGEGEFGRVGATAVTVNDAARRMNQVDWTAGVKIFQARVAPTKGAACQTSAIGDECLPEARPGSNFFSDTPFGYNWTAPTKPLSWPFQFFTAAELGADPAGEKTAAPASFRTYPPDGFASFIIPFFSSRYLEEERGLGSQVTDFRLTRATRENGRKPRYFCVRLSWDGSHLHQLCDPNDPSTGAMTGVVRAAIVEFWNDLKRAHFLDAQTRVLILTIPMLSNNVGSQARVRIFFELTSTGAVLPSYDSQTRVVLTDSLESLEFWLWIGFGFCIYFCMMEVFEILGLEDGVFELDDLLDYVRDMWNVADWICYLIYFQSWRKGRDYISLARNIQCVSDVCMGVGYQDEYEVYLAARDLKLYLSFSVCLQLLKIMKIMAILVPKMGLAPAVLKKALPDLFTFAGVFMISVLAFSSIFHLVLGSVMVEYNDKFASFVSLGRALFGDFDINEVLENSPSYMNSIIYLAYLFVAVFILLSMFLAILGEAQANLRDDQRVELKSKAAAGEPLPSEYGVLDSAFNLVVVGVEKVPFIGPKIKEKKKRVKEEELEKQAQSKKVTPVDRIEARQLELRIS